MVNWTVGSVLAWPVAAMFARRWKVTRGGVPVVQLNRFVHDFPQPEPGRTARHFFRWYSFGAALTLGFCFAKYMTDSSQRCGNAWYSRPDLKPFAAMVAKPKNNLTEETMI